MSAARLGRQDNRTAVRSKRRSVHGPSSVSAQAPASGSALSIAKSAFSGRAWWVSLALIAAIVVIYAPVRHYDFVNYDDPEYVGENPYVSGGLTWHNVAWAFTTGYFANWHPLTWLSHMLDVQVYGLNAGPHHLTSVLLHIANTLLLFGLLHRMTGALGRSGFVAGLFAVHPLHVESVAWVAERKDVLSTLFWMLTLWGYVWYVRRPRLRRYLVVFLLFALGLMAKPMLVTLPFVLLLMDFWPLGRVAFGPDPPGRSGLATPGNERLTVVQLVWEKLPLFALTLVSSIVTFVVQQRVGAVAGPQAIPLGLRVTNALVSYLAYIGKMLWPARLALFYPYSRSLPEWWVVGSILGLIGMSVVVIRAARRHPYLPVGWLWYLGTLVPVIGLVQVGGQSMADRYTYVPLMGLFIIVAWGIPGLLARWPYRSMALPAAAGLVLLACTITAQGQVRYWKDSIALWSHALEVTTGNFLAHYNLGVVLTKQGKVAEAIAHYSEALRLKPDSVEALNNLGVALAKQGSIDEAIHEFLEALRIKPNDADAHYNVAALLLQQGKPEDAARHFEAVLKLNPGYQQARSALDGLKSRGNRSGPGSP